MHSSEIPKQPSVNPHSASSLAHLLERTQVLPITSSIKDLAWKPNGMDINTFLIDPKHASRIMAESSELKQMDEEPKSIDLRDLESFSLEQGCK